MELKNKLSMGAKKVDYLMEEYFNREKTLGYCKACPDYSNYWSCPPYRFDEAIFLKQFKYAHLIGRQYEISREDIRNIRNPDDISAYCKEKLDIIKVMTWKTLLEIENDIEGSLGLIPGNCPICGVQKLSCARETNQACRNQSLMRYSLESLGFNVVDLVKYEVGMTIKWPENFWLPPVLTSVSAILCNEEIPQNVLKKYFPDKKKSWVKYDETQRDTGFHTTEVITAEETVHGQLKEEAIDSNDMDDEILKYRPQKSWLGYKAEKAPEDPMAKKGWTVTIQGEEFEEEVEIKTPIEEEDVYEALLLKKTPEVEIKTEPQVSKEPLKEETIEEEDQAKYRWLGFKADLDEEAIEKRPIPKMSELILEGEEVEEEVVLEEVVLEEAIPSEVLETKEAVIEIPSEEQRTEEFLETEEISEIEEVFSSEEEEDSKYQWLGFKAKVDEDEIIVTKNTLSSINVPK